MKPDQLEYFRGLFTQKIEGLLGEAGKTVSEMTGGTESFPDVTDRASQESDRNFELRIRDRERKLVKTPGYHPLHSLQNKTGKTGKTAGRIGVSTQISTALSGIISYP